MEVDLSRQPNINPDGVCYVGDTKQNKLGYMGYYFVYGEIDKTSNDAKKPNDENTISEFSFADTEFGKNTHVAIKQIEKDKLAFEFYIEVDKTTEI